MCVLGGALHLAVASATLRAAVRWEVRGRGLCTRTVKVERQTSGDTRTSAKKSCMVEARSCFGVALKGRWGMGKAFS